MANEISLTASLIHSQGGTTVNGTVNKVITQTGTKRVANVQIIGTSSEAIVLGDVTPRYAYFKNLDSTNFVYIGYQTACTSANAFLKLLPGEASVCCLAQSVLYALADTANVNLEVILVEV
jgi:hypothetical protein